MTGSSTEATAATPRPGGPPFLSPRLRRGYRDTHAHSLRAERPSRALRPTRALRHTRATRPPTTSSSAIATAATPRPGGPPFLSPRLRRGYRDTHAHPLRAERPSRALRPTRALRHTRVTRSPTTSSSAIATRATPRPGGPPSLSPRLRRGYRDTHAHPLRAERPSRALRPTRALRHTRVTRSPTTSSSAIATRATPRPGGPPSLSPRLRRGYRDTHAHSLRAERPSRALRPTRALRHTRVTRSPTTSSSAIATAATPRPGGPPSLSPRLRRGYRDTHAHSLRAERPSRALRPTRALRHTRPTRPPTTSSSAIATAATPRPGGPPFLSPRLRRGYRDTHAHSLRAERPSRALRPTRALRHTRATRPPTTSSSAIATAATPRPGGPPSLSPRLRRGYRDTHAHSLRAERPSRALRPTRALRHTRVTRSPTTSTSAIATAATPRPGGPPFLSPRLRRGYRDTHAHPLRAERPSRALRPTRALRHTRVTRSLTTSTSAIATAATPRPGGPPSLSPRLRRGYRDTHSSVVRFVRCGGVNAERDRVTLRHERRRFRAGQRPPFRRVRRVVGRCLRRRVPLPRRLRRHRIRRH